ncbi:hypothetical protein [Myxococcus phage Mx1]|nr:hypothetical protein [Myxococcus phage Mx1]
MNTNKNEMKKDVRIQGAHILKSYLVAVGLEVAPGSSDSAFAVTGKNGTLTVAVVDANEQAEADVCVAAEEATSFKADTALQALWSVTEAAGYGRPVPVNRGERPNGRISYHENFEDVYLRHGLFRRSPNRTAAELEPYMKIVKGCSRKAYYKFFRTFGPMGYTVEDLESVSMVHTISFLHNYAVSTDQNENMALLAEFLSQRLGEFAKLTSKKAQNCTCLPSSVADTVGIPNAEGEASELSAIDVFAEAKTPSPDEEYEEENDFFVLGFPDGVERTLRVVNDGFLGLNLYLDGILLAKDEANKLTELIRNGKVSKRIEQTHVDVQEEEPEEKKQVRKEKARQELHTRLNAMDKSTRETVLSYAALSRDYCPDARRAARQLCDELACPKCLKKVPSGSVCLRCNVEARPRFGVDYVAYRDQLRAEGHSMAEAMSVPVPDNETRGKSSRAVVTDSTPIAETLNDTDKGIVQPTTKMNKAEIEAMSKKMAEDFMASLPDKMECPKCKDVKPKDAFGIRVAKDKKTGIPFRPARQSYCKKCRRPS